MITKLTMCQCKLHMPKHTWKGYAPRTEFTLCLRMGNISRSTFPGFSISCRIIPHLVSFVTHRLFGCCLIQLAPFPALLRVSTEYVVRLTCITFATMGLLKRFVCYAFCAKNNAKTGWVVIFICINVDV